MRYETEITIDLLRRNNRIFFENAGFHGDKGYSILNIKGKKILAVANKLTKVAYYEIDENLQLHYTNI